MVARITLVCGFTALAGAASVAYVAWRRRRAGGEPAIEAHQAGEVSREQRRLREIGAAHRLARPWRVRARLVPDATPLPPVDPLGPIVKIVHFIRHGEGLHNVAQREWRADPGWDGESEPYTVDNDPEYRFVDAELTPKGIGQAEALAARANRLAPELMVSRPLARAGARAGRGRS